MKSGKVDKGKMGVVQSCSVMEAEMNAYSIEVSVTEFCGVSEDVRRWGRLEVVKLGKWDKGGMWLIWWCGESSAEVPGRFIR